MLVNVERACIFQRSIGPGFQSPASLSPERTHAGSDTQRVMRSPLYDFFVDRDSLNRTLSGCPLPAAKGSRYGYSRMTGQPISW